MMFSIVIPNYNSEKWIEKCLNSVLNQSYKNFELIIVDDVSTDNSVEIIKTYNDPRIKLIELKEKRYNGGTRNVGVENSKGNYLLFLDCDDWFYSRDCLKEIVRVIDTNPVDLIRLPYRYIAKKEKNVFFRENTLEELANTVFIAPWTKCIKRELFVPFPENTLIEDIVQHIAQIDVIETFSRVHVPIVVWNRQNEDAISSDTKKYTRRSKRYSSIYRNVADLIDLQCKHDYCEKQRQFRLNIYLDVIRRKDELALVSRG